MSEPAYYPARPLFGILARGMAANRLTAAGPFGTTTMAAPAGGTVTGERFSGRIAENLANEWQTASPRLPGMAAVRGLITLMGDDGEPVLMKYVGRRSRRHGGGWRIGACFEAGGAAEWLNDVTAVGRVETVGEDLRFTLSELLGRQSPVDGHALPCAPLYTMAASGSLGQRIRIASPLGGRYLSMAESGCDTRGRLEAHWPAGFAWGAHRSARPEGAALAFPFHIDLTAGLVTPDGSTVLQSYIGTNSRAGLDPAPQTDRSWSTVATFEAPATGEHAWLNEIVAIGHGWVANAEATYAYYVYD